MDFEFKIFLESLPALLDGALLTLQLTLVSVTIGLTIGVMMGLARVSKNAALKYVAVSYVTVFRGVPLLVTLMFLYYGLPSAGLQLSAYAVGVIALSVTNGAYVTEIGPRRHRIDRYRADARGAFARHVVCEGHAAHRSAASAAPRAAADHQ